MSIKRELSAQDLFNKELVLRREVSNCAPSLGTVNCVMTERIRMPFLQVKFE